MPFESSGSSWVTATRALPCPYCGLLASRLHQQRCTKRPETCPQCHHVVSAASLAAHMEGDCPEKKAVCPGCGDSLLASLLEIHITTECRSNTFACWNCWEAFGSATDYVRHALPRCTRMVVPCQLCGVPIGCSALAAHYRECSLKQFPTETSPPKQLGEGSAVPPLSARPAAIPPSPRRLTPRQDHEHFSPLKCSPAATTVPFANVHVSTSASRLRPATAPAGRHGRPRSATKPQEAPLHHSSSETAPGNEVRGDTGTCAEGATSHHPRPASARIPAPEPNRSAGSQHRQTPLPFGDCEPRRGVGARGSSTASKGQPSRSGSSPDKGGDVKSGSHSIAGAAALLPPFPATTHAFVLRQQCASAKRQFGLLSSLSPSLVVKDRKQAIWSETIRRRELEQRLREHQSTTPELPSFILNGRGATGRT